jgi:hypothetical protein
MRGGSQAHLFRCSDSEHYVVKFLNNPQGVRILANEFLGTRLATRLGLPTTSTAVIEVHEALIKYTEDLVVQNGHGREPCQAGLQFGSRYPGPLLGTVVHDFLPDEHLREITNLSNFCGMLVFDKWTCNTDGRQVIFSRGRGESRYRVQMIDQGSCFNADVWNFPDAPLRGIYPRSCVYETVRGIEAFEPWLTRLETEMTKSILDDVVSQIPPEWYRSEREALDRLLEQLLRRRSLVRELIVSAWKSSAQSFPNWK